MPLLSFCVVHDNDPTRIPGIIRALQDAWEGQPDLTLPAFIGMLHNRGLTWGSTEEELLELLAKVRQEHPSLIDAPLATPILITTASPALLVTLTPDSMVVVRSASNPGSMPSIWRYESMRPAGPGRPLVLTDEEGVQHRLGVVTLVARVDEEAAPSLDSLKRVDVGNARWLVQLDGGRRALIGQRVRLWEQRRREVEATTITWERIEVGAHMKVAPAGGGEPLVLGPVERVLLVEV